MKMKMIDIIVKANQLNAIAQKKLPFKVSYAIGKNKDHLIREAERYEEQRKKLCETYADKDDNGDPVIAERENENGIKVSEYILSAENRAELNKELEEFRNMDLDVNIMTIAPEDLEKIDASDKYDALSADELSVLYFMIDE